MSAVYLVVLSVLFLNFYRQSYGGGPPAAACAVIRPSQPAVTATAAATAPADVTTPNDVSEHLKAEPAAAAPPVPEDKAEKSLSEYRVGTMNHFVRAMMSHGFGCFIKED